jgi:hypothetical protein
MAKALLLHAQASAADAQQSYNIAMRRGQTMADSASYNMEKLRPAHAGE